MSFDMSVPLNSGNYLTSQSLSIRAMSFDVLLLLVYLLLNRLNPFRAGRCLSTLSVCGIEVVCESQSLSIRAMSFDERNQAAVKRAESQSLSFRAMSFELFGDNFKSGKGLNPFRSGRCLSTAVCWRQESCGLSDPLPNFFGRLRSWLLI